MKTLSKEQARKILLRHQELENPRQISSPDQIVSLIEKLGCIQYDPLNQVGRNADLVLQSRCKNYSEETLFDLLYKQRSLIDGWDKCMSIWPVKDWASFKRFRDRSKERYQERAKELNPTRNTVRRLLKENGVINSSAIANDKKVDWGWAPSKIGRVVLESMLHCGELAIHHKQGTRKYYDFASNLLPKAILKAKDPNKSEEEYFRWHTKRRINAVGLLWNKAGDAWLGIKNLNKEARTKSIEHLLNEGGLESFRIEGLNEDFYASKDVLSLLNDSSDNHEASIIAPLDNLIWDRKLIQALFDFDYKWEVYIPVKKRKYGYYVLPILYKDKFIARFEPILDKRKKALVIKNWWWEKGIKIDQQTVDALIRCFNAFLAFTKMDRIVSKTTKTNKHSRWIDECKN